jgi:FtsP/CotA-like multicopper oxidase with cupredoxin domain
MARVVGASSPAGTSNTVASQSLRPTARNSIVYQYPNSQPATTLWYHDHALGITRINVFAGLAAFYLVRDEFDTGRTNNPLRLPAGPHEVELMIQDRLFDTNGQLRFPDGSNTDADLDGPPSNPLTHPLLDPRVLRRRHGRQRQDMADTGRRTPPLPVPVRQRVQRPLPADEPHRPGERLIHHATVRVAVLADRHRRRTAGPTRAAQRPIAGRRAEAVPRAVRTCRRDHRLRRDAGPLITDAHPIHIHLIQFQVLNRQLVDVDSYRTAWAARFPGGRYAGQQCDGTFGLTDYAAGQIIPGYGPPDDYDTPNTDGALGGNPAISPFLSGPIQPPDPNEAGWKDTLKINPGMVNRVLVRWAPIETPISGAAPGVNRFSFDPTTGPGYVWHCHILDHEDNEMMRPYIPVK